MATSFLRVEKVWVGQLAFVDVPIFNTMTLLPCEVTDIGRMGKVEIVLIGDPGRTCHFVLTIALWEKHVD